VGAPHCGGISGGLQRVFFDDTKLPAAIVELREKSSAFARL
jgi:hypothetical protein